MSRGLTLSDIYSGELVDANELQGSTRVVVTTPWGLLGPATLTDITTWLAANGLIATSLIDQPDGVAGLDEDGHIVGPIILSVYANAAAAGVLADGTLAIVAGKLVRGDGATTGGVQVERNRTDVKSFTNTTPTSLDPLADGAFMTMTSDVNNRVIIVTNSASFPVGYTITLELVISGAATPPLTLNTTLGTSGSISVVATAEGSYRATFQRVSALETSNDWRQISAFPVS